MSTRAFSRRNTDGVDRAGVMELLPEQGLPAEPLVKEAPPAHRTRGRKKRRADAPPAHRARPRKGPPAPPACPAARRVDALLDAVRSASEADDEDDDDCRHAGPHACLGCGDVRVRWFACRGKGCGGPHAPPCAPLQSGGRLDDGAVGAFGRDAVVAYLDAHLERHLRSVLREPTCAEQAARNALAVAALPEPSEAARVMTVIADRKDALPCDEVALGDDCGLDSESYWWFKDESQRPADAWAPRPRKHAIVERLDAARAVRDAAFARRLDVRCQPREIWRHVLALSDVATHGRALAACRAFRGDGAAAAPAVFEAALGRFPAAAYQAPYLPQPLDHRALFKRNLELHRRADDGPRPRRLTPTRSFDAYVFTVELIDRSDDVVFAATATVDEDASGTVLRTEVCTSDACSMFDVVTAHDDEPGDDRWDAIDGCKLRVLVIDTASGGVACLQPGGRVEDVDECVYYESGILSIREMIEGLVDDDDGPDPCVDSHYNCHEKRFYTTFRLLSEYDSSDMARRDVLCLLEHLIDFNI